MPQFWRPHFFANGENRQELVHGTDDECERQLLGGAISRTPRETDTASGRCHSNMHDELRPKNGLTVELNAGPHVMERKYKLRIGISASLNYLRARHHIVRHFWIGSRADRSKQIVHPADRFGDFPHPGAAKAKYQPLPRFS